MLGLVTGTPKIIIGKTLNENKNLTASEPTRDGHVLHSIEFHTSVKLYALLHRLLLTVAQLLVMEGSNRSNVEPHSFTSVLSIL